MVVIGIHGPSAGLAGIPLFVGVPSIYGSNEIFPLLKERDPAKGWRGISRSLDVGLNVFQEHVKTLNNIIRTIIDI